MGSKYTNYWTSPFAVLERQNPWIDVFQERIATDFKAQKLPKCSTGKAAFTWSTHVFVHFIHLD